MAKIAVLFHEQDSNPENYIINNLARIWRSDGHSVVYLYGTARLVEADILFLHINLSLVPDRYRQFAARYPVVLNGRITDIRKSRISTDRLSRGDEWSGPVIVKSDLNYAGWPEQRFNQYFLLTWLELRFPLLQRARIKLYEMRHQDLPMCTSDYKIFAGIDDVPPKWLASHRVIAEKFLPERENGLYHVRIYQALGSRWTCMRLSSPHPIIKAHNSISAEEIAPEPEIEQWRRTYHLDFGKIDYVIHNGRTVVLDINKTTGYTPGSGLNEELEQGRRRIAEGLYDYLSPNAIVPF